MGLTVTVLGLTFHLQYAFDRKYFVLYQYLTGSLANRSRRSLGVKPNNISLRSSLQINACPAMRLLQLQRFKKIRKMHLKSLFHYSALATAVAAANICPILGPVFPAPRNLHSVAAFQDTLEGIRAKIEEAFIAGNTTHGLVNSNDTYSIQIFSTASEDLLFDYHRRGSDVLGNRTIDGDSIYRIARYPPRSPKVVDSSITLT